MAKHQCLDADEDFVALRTRRRLPKDRRTRWRSRSAEPPRRSCSPSMPGSGSFQSANVRTGTRRRAAGHRAAGLLGPPPPPSNRLVIARDDLLRQPAGRTLPVLPRPQGRQSLRWNTRPIGWKSLLPSNTPAKGQTPLTRRLNAVRTKVPEPDAYD